MRELWSKIKEALISALPITLIVYAVSLLPWFNFTHVELITSSISAGMLVVEKRIRNQILNALYTQMGMGKKAQGIAFSLPVSDVTGLVSAAGEEKGTPEG